MIAGIWNLIDLSGLEVLLECQKRGIKVVPAGVFGSGLLWGSTHFRYESVTPEVAEKTKQWKELATKYGVTLPGVALAFAYLPLCVETVCAGCKSARHVDTNVALCKDEVPAALWKEARDVLKLLPADFPLPE